MSRFPMCEAAPRAVSQSPAPQSIAAFSRAGAFSNSFFTIAKSLWA